VGRVTCCDVTVSPAASLQNESAYKMIAVHCSLLN